MIKKILKFILSTNIRHRIRRIINSPSILYEKITFNIKMDKATPLFIYQMGKVGSISIKNSLTKIYPGNIIHGHRYFIDHPDWRTKRLYNWISNNNELKIISPIRSPIDRNISFFFQNLNKYSKSKYGESDLLISELIEIFLTRFDHDSPNKFYENDMITNFSINVYDSPFPVHGYKIYHNNNISLLIIKSELSNTIKSKVIQQYAGVTHLNLTHQNVSLTKSYGPRLEKFKQELKIPRDYLNQIFSSKYFTHFYNNESIEQLLGKWQI